MAGKFRGKVGKLTKTKVAPSTKKARAKSSTSMVKRSPKLPEGSLLARIAALTSSGTPLPSSSQGTDPSSSSSPLQKAGHETKGKKSTLDSRTTASGISSMEEETRCSSSRSSVDHGHPSPSVAGSGKSLLLSKKKASKTPKQMIEKPMGRAAIELVPAGAIIGEKKERLLRRGSSGKNKEDVEEDAGDAWLNGREEEAESEEDDEETVTERSTSSPHQGIERVVPTKKVANPSDQRTPAEAVGLRLLHQALKSQGHNRLLPFQQRPDYEYRLRQVATLGVVELFRSFAAARKAGEAVVHALEAGEELPPFGGSGIYRTEMGIDGEKKDGYSRAVVKGDGVRLTEDKVRERKELVSKEAFLAALRRSPAVAG